MSNPLHTLFGTRAQRLAEPLPARPVRIAWYAVLFVLGALVSLCGCFVQGLWSPAGLLFALLANGAVCYLGLRATGTKLGAGVPMIGWFLVLLVLLSPAPRATSSWPPGLTRTCTSWAAGCPVWCARRCRPAHRSPSAFRASGTDRTRRAVNAPAP